MDVGAGKFFSSPADVSNFMPCELSWSTPECSDCPWIFCSRQSNELQSIHGVEYTESIHGNRTIVDKIKAALKELADGCSTLIQFWAPIKTAEGRIYLTTADQPFSLTKFHNGLCSHRKFCVSNMLIPDDEEEQKLWPPARVFRHKVPEMCSDVRYYLSEEFSQRDFVINHGVRNYCALPLFELIGQQCVGVLEILSTSADDSLEDLDYTYDIIEKVDLKCYGSLPLNSFRDCQGYPKVNKAIAEICRSHQLRSAQLWRAPSSTATGIYLFDRWVANEDDEDGFYDSFPLFRSWGSKGVVEKAFSSRSACFCKNVSKLSVSVCPSVPNARKLGLTGCFAICLQRTEYNDYFYILEFFFPCSGMDYGDPINFLSMLVSSLKLEIQSSPGAYVHMLGEKLFVEVMKTSSDDELDSFEICATTHTEGREVMQHDFPLAYSRNNISAEQIDVVGPLVRPGVLQNSLLQQAVMEPDAVNEERNIGTGDISISAFGVPAKRSTASKPLDQGGNNIVTTQGDGSSCHESIRVPDHINRGNLVNIDRDASSRARKQGQGNVSIKQNIDTRYGPHSLPQQSVAADDINGETSVRIEQDDANGLRNQGKIWTLDREYGINREVLEQHSGKKLEDVAAILGVSRSTLKRICRRHGIYRWPPCKAKRSRRSVNPQVSIHAIERRIEDQSLTNQSLPDLPQEIFSVSKPHAIPNATKEQDTSSIMVKAAYKDDMIKFPLSFSSGKVNLEEEVAMRLNLLVGNFKIKYLDEDEDWILVTCDADLRTCMSTLRSSSRTTIKMKVC